MGRDDEFIDKFCDDFRSIYTDFPTGIPRIGFRPLVCDLSIFTTEDPSGIVSEDEREDGQFGLLDFLDAMCSWNTKWLKRNFRTPPLYDSGMSYFHDVGFEWWADAKRAWARKKADCKVLTCWRVAELNLALQRYYDDLDRRIGRKNPRLYAKAHIFWDVVKAGDKQDRFRVGSWLYHVVVIRPVATLMISPPPMLNTPDGPTVYQALEYDFETQKVSPKAGWVHEDPSRVLGMYWENVYSQSNKRPASRQFAGWFGDATGIPWVSPSAEIALDAPARTTPPGEIELDEPAPKRSAA